jgi:hypothetical protein
MMPMDARIKLLSAKLDHGKNSGMFLAREMQDLYAVSPYY